MGIRILESRRRALIADEALTRLAVFADERGHTRVVSDPELRLSQNGRLLLLELSTQPALVGQLALQQSVTLGLGGRRGEQLNIVARVSERYTVGRLFQSLHEEIAAAHAGAELLAVWGLEALEIEGEEESIPFLADRAVPGNALAAWATQA